MALIAKQRLLWIVGLVFGAAGTASIVYGMTDLIGG
jgi:hypothetical protein